MSLELDTTSITVGSKAAVNTNGYFSATILIPAATAVGGHEVDVNGRDTSAVLQTAAVAIKVTK